MQKNFLQCDCNFTKYRPRDVGEVFPSFDFVDFYADYFFGVADLCSTRMLPDEARPISAPISSSAFSTCWMICRLGNLSVLWRCRPLDQQWIAAHARMGSAAGASRTATHARGWKSIDLTFRGRHGQNSASLPKGLFIRHRLCAGYRATLTIRRRQHGLNGYCRAAVVMQPARQRHKEKRSHAGFSDPCRSGQQLRDGDCRREPTILPHVEEKIRREFEGSTASVVGHSGEPSNSVHVVALSVLKIDPKTRPGIQSSRILRIDSQC